MPTEDELRAMPMEELLKQDFYKCPSWWKSNRYVGLKRPRSPGGRILFLEPAQNAFGESVLRIVTNDGRQHMVWGIAERHYAQLVEKFGQGGSAAGFCELVDQLKAQDIREAERGEYV